MKSIVSLADNFTVQFSNLLKLPLEWKTKQLNRPGNYQELRETGPLEHVNRSMKVSGGLVGITLNPNARTKYFLIAPELARVAEQATQMVVSSSMTPKHHHTLATAVRLLQEKNIEQLTITIRGCTNPFLEDILDWTYWTGRISEVWGNAHPTHRPKT